jgi:hypothetical protein
MKITYKFTKKLFDLSPKHHELTEYLDPGHLIKYISGYESALSDSIKSKYDIQLQSPKLKTKEKIDKIYFNDKLVWDYRTGFTRNWELFKLENTLRD